MFQKLINHRSERPNSVLAESLKSWAPLSGAILVSNGPKLHAVKTWDAGGTFGDVGRTGVCVGRGEVRSLFV